MMILGIIGIIIGIIIGRRIRGIIVVMGIIESG